MSNINRDYLIVLNPKTSKVTVPELNYYIYDKYTANLFVNLVTVENGKIVNMADADQYKLVLHVLKPTNEIQTVEDIQVFNKEKALFQIELDQELTKNIGRYKCELLTIDKTDHIVQSAKFSYRVKKSIYNDLDVVTETPQYPIIITLLDKLQDIDKYEEERRANEVARVAAEKARVKDYTDLRQTVTTDIDTMQEKIDSFDGKVQEVDNAVDQMRTNITNYQTEKNKELDSYKTQKDTQINTSIKNMENTIDTYKTEKDKQINDKITQQDTKIDKAIDLQNKNIQASTKALNDKLDAAVQDQNNTIAANNQAQNKVISDAVAAQNKTINTVVESDKVQNDRLDTLETNDTNNKAEIKKLQDKDVEHEERMTAIEAVNVEQNNRLDAIEIKNDQQDSRLNDVEAKNKKQDLDLKCLFAESHSERITLEDEVGNSVFLQNSKQGFATVDELKGNTLVNCNKDTDKELILNGNIDTSGYGTVTTTEGVDGGLVDVMCEGNTMVNVCDQEDPIAITKNYEVTTGNHIALQGEYDGKCRPVLNGNSLVNLALPKNPYTYKKDNVANNEINLVYNLKAGVTYTLIRTISNFSGGVIQEAINFYDMSYYADGKQAQDHNCQYRGNGQYVSKYTPTKDVVKMQIIIGMINIDKDNGIYPTITISNYMILEGDYTNKPIPNYFTGLQSSFEDSYIPKTLVENNTQWTWSPSNKFKQILSASDTPITSSKITLVINCSSVSGYPLAVIRKVDGTDVTNLIDTKVGLNIATLENTGTITELKLFRDNNAQGYIIDNAFIVEGDYTNYDFTNYDSSKGGKYKVDYKVTGKNKFDKSKTLDGYEINNIGAGTIAANDKWFVTDFIPAIPNTTYAISGKGNGNTVMCYDENKQFIYGITNGGISQITTPSNVRYIKLNGLLTQKDTFQIEEGTKATTYEPYKESIKTFYLNSPLLEGDTIEDINGKATHVHRYGKVVLDGSDDESWAIKQDDWELPNSIVFATVFPNGKGYNWKTYTGEESVSDKIPSYGDDYLRTNDVFGYTNDNISANKYFRIPKSYLSTQDVAGFRKYLQQNPATVVYELAKPTYETISNDSILCDSYVNGHLDVDSVVPIDKVVFQSYGTSLKYLSPNTEYIIQFESDSNGKLDALALNSSDVIGNLNIVKGINKFNITTSDKITINYLWTTGIGFNMSKVVVTPKVEQTFGYFKGMKSVGECEDNTVEILSRNINEINVPEFTIRFTNKLFGGYNVNLPVKGKTFSYRYDYEIISIDTEQDRFVTNLAGSKSKSSDPNYINTDFDLSTVNQRLYNGAKGTVIRNNITNTGANTLLELRCIRTLNPVTMTYKITNFALYFSDNADTYIPYKENKQTMTHEPLRALPNGIKDKYVIIDGKWYIERNCIQLIMDSEFIQNKTLYHYVSQDYPDVVGFATPNKWFKWDSSLICSNLPYDGYRNISAGHLISNQEKIFVNDLIFITLNKNKVNTLNEDGFREYLKNNPIVLVGQNTTPTYEPIDYNSFEVYSATTHISNNSNIPCNMVIRNSGFNCMLKPNTTYTVSSNNGLSSVVTKDSIGDSVLRFYDKDTTSVTKMSKVLVLEGDYITGNPPIPGFFKDMESTFEQELVTDEKDKNYDKYKVTVKAVGKNLFDINKIIKGQKADGTINANYSCSEFIKVLPNNTYYLKNYNGYRFDGIVQYSQDKVKLNSNIGFTVTSNKFITSNKCYYIKVQIFNPSWSDFKCDVQLEQGDKATEYEPYKENNITFYLKEPLRGVGDVKDKVYVKEDKVMVERNCVSYVLDPNKIPSPSPGDTKLYMYNIAANNSIINTRYGKVVCNSFACDVNNAHDRSRANTISTVVDGTVPNGVIRIITDKNKETLKQYLQQNPTTVIYQLATPVYEEVEYFDLKLFVEIFKDTTIIYNSNIPVTSTINYTYSTPLTDAVNTVSDISDQQDSMIIDMATQVATMEMMLM
jgi:hypothetical protein